MQSLPDPYCSGTQLPLGSIFPRLHGNHFEIDLPKLSLRTAGNFPFKEFAEGRFPHFDSPKTWWVEICPLFEEPHLCGIIAQNNCTHGDVLSQYRDIINNESIIQCGKKADQRTHEKLDSNLVDAFFRYNSGEVYAELRPNFGQEELTLKAIKLLKAQGFKDEQILFVCENSGHFHCIANLGMLHKIKLLSLNNSEEVNKYIESNTIKLQSGVQYLYRPAGGVRYITPSEIKSLFLSIMDPEALKCKLDEISKLIASVKEAGVLKRHADFLIVKDGRPSQPSPAFRNEFQKIRDLAASIENSDWPSRWQEVHSELNKFYTFFENETDDLFKTDSPHDPQWSYFVARILLGKASDDGKGVNWGKQFLGGTEHLPGGMIGYIDASGELHYGAQEFESIMKVVEYYPQLGEIHGHNCNQLRRGQSIVLSPTDTEDSVIVFTPRKDLQSRTSVAVKKYIFHPETTAIVKALMNIALEEDAEITGSFVTDINISRDRRDPEPDLIQQFGVNSHSVNVLGKLRVVDGNRAVELTRYERLAYGIQQLRQNSIAGRSISEETAKVISEVHLQFKLLQAYFLSELVFPLGPRVPLLTSNILPDKINGQTLPIEYISRIFLEGEALHMRSRFNTKGLNLSLAFADEVGLLAAYDIKSRRRNHRDGDEIVETHQIQGDKASQEILFRLASARSAFPPPSQIPSDNPYGASINLISSHLSADMAASRWMEQKYPAKVPPLFSEYYLDTALDSLATNLKLIKATIEEKGNEMMRRVRREFQSDKLNYMKREFGSNSPVVEIMDFPACFARSIEDIKALNIERLTEELANNVQGLSIFYQKVISGLESQTEVDKVLKHLENLFGSNSWYTDFPITHSLLRAPVELDPNWESYNVDQRLQAISTQRVCAWTKKIRMATANEKLDMSEIADSALYYYSISENRHEALKIFNYNLTKRMPGIALSSDTIGYFYDALTSPHLGKETLKKLGYLFY